MEKASQLVILKDEQIVYSLLMNNKELVQVNAEQASLNGTLLGNIYIGKVKNIVKNINAAFVKRFLKWNRDKILSVLYVKLLAIS